MSAKPTIVIVHGSWHSPRHFDTFATYLRENGYEVVVPSLPSMFADDLSQIKDLTSDISAIREAITTALEHRHVYIVTHSYGTVPATASVRDLDIKTRTSQGYRTSVLGFAVIAGLMIPQDIDVMSFFGGGPVLMHDVHPDGLTAKPLTPPGPAYWFYHDCAPEVAIEASRLIVPQAYVVNRSASPWAGHLHVKTHYLICEKDNALPSFLQRMMIDRARADAKKKGLEEGWISAKTVDSSHSPFMSRTEWTGKWLRRMMGEDIQLDETADY